MSKLKWICLSFFINNVATATTSQSGVLGNLDIQQILINLTSLVVPLTNLVLAISFISGVFFIFKGISMLRSISLQAGKQEGGIAGPFVYLGIGAVLLYMPATTDIFSTSIFGSGISMLFPSNDTVSIDFEDGTSSNVTVTSNYDQSASSQLMQYVSIGAGQDWAMLINTVVMFIQLIGFIAFVRGWFILVHVGQAGAQQGSFAKGLIHVIGGVVAINFVPAMQAIAGIVSSTH